MKKLFTVSLLLAASLIILSACGHSRRAPTIADVSSSSSVTSSAQPEWLTDALAELDAMACPMNVRPEVFADLKERLREALLERASGKGVSEFLEDDNYSKVRDLQWEQDAPGLPVYLTWGYVHLGDYTQNGIVNIADITPLAQHISVPPKEPEEWSGNPYDPDYYSIQSVVDGNQDTEVTIDDIEQIAGNYGNCGGGYLCGGKHPGLSTL